MSISALQRAHFTVLSAKSVPPAALFGMQQDNPYWTKSTNIASHLHLNQDETIRTKLIKTPNRHDWVSWVFYFGAYWRTGMDR